MMIVVLSMFVRLFMRGSPPVVVGPAGPAPFPRGVIEVSGEYGCVVDLGVVRVAVVTDHDGLVEYLRDFYLLEPDSDHSGTAGWTLEAWLGKPEAAMALTPWRVGYRADRDTRRAVICSTTSRDLAITVRKAIREVLLDYCETHRYAMLHASAAADEKWLVIVRAAAKRPSLWALP